MTVDAPAGMKGLDAWDWLPGPAVPDVGEADVYEAGTHGLADCDAIGRRRACRVVEGRPLAADRRCRDPRALPALPVPRLGVGLAAVTVDVVALHANCQATIRGRAVNGTQKHVHTGKRMHGPFLAVEERGNRAPRGLPVEGTDGDAVRGFQARHVPRTAGTGRPRR
jgi:hypothetical protein